MRIKSTKRFDKMFKKAPSKVQNAFLKRVKLFEENKYHPLLNNHALAGKLRNWRSINITGDWRAAFEELDNGEIIFFIMIGAHSQLYK